MKDKFGKKYEEFDTLKVTTKDYDEFRSIVDYMVIFKDSRVYKIGSKYYTNVELISVEVLDVVIDQEVVSPKQD